MSRLLLFWLIFVLANVLKNAGRIISCLTLLKKVMSLSRSVGTILFISQELKLMRLGLCKEDLFALLFCHGHFHCLTEVATVKVAEELYLTPHELMHRHEGGLLGWMKPVDQLVATIGEPGGCLKVSLMHSPKFALVWSAFVRHCLAIRLIHLVRPTS